MPSTPADFKGLLKAAVRDDNPVMFFMDMGLMNTEGEVPDGDHVVPIGQSATRRQGQDVTIVSYGKLVDTPLTAAEALASAGMSAEVIDLRSLKPYDEAAILASVRKTGRAVIVHEASRSCGVGAEIAATIAEKAFGALKGPVIRIAGPDAPAPSSYALEMAFVPQAGQIVAAARTLTGKA
jgi:acetoin:2,6-dichlorophenolindophenol oxidoreductase subunit beta